MRKELFIFALGLICILFLMQDTSAITYQQGTPVDLKHAVRVNGGIAGSTNCNITVLYPNATTLINFQPMSNTTSYYNYTLNSNQTQTKGEYHYDVTCISGTLNETESFSFLVNLGGVEPTEGRTLAISRTTYLTFAFALLFLISFFFSKKPVIRWSLFLIAALFILISVNLVFISLQDEIVNPTLENLFAAFTSLSFIMYWAIGLALGILWVFSIFITVMASMQDRKRERTEGEF